MRKGLTLLELLLATSMLIVLFGIVGNIVLLFSRMESHRAQYAEQQRIVRNWTRLLNDDFRSVIQDAEQLNKTVGSETIRHFGVAGTSTQLRIDISDYSWRSAESSELRTIFYEFHPIYGFTRRERDYAAPKSADGASQSALEIVAGNFRYFDGASWHEHWASLDRKSAPSAVEITFYALPQSEAQRWRSRQRGTLEPVLNRVLIQVPSAFRAYESYQRVQAPRPPQEERPIPTPSLPVAPRPPAPPPPSPFHSLFGDD